MAQTSQQFGEWPLKRLMTAVVGSGHKSADDMTRDQAREALQRVFAGEPDPTTLGAFWLANRWKRNTPEELAAYTDVMHEESVVTAQPDCDPIDCGANYDGKHSSALLGVGAGLVAAAAGTPVVVHSGDRVPTQKATAYKHVLEELGVRTELAPAESADMVDETGFGFYYQPEFNPLVDDLYDRRDQMGVRTFVNTIETVANPANADVHLGSFYHLAFAKKLVDLIGNSEELTFSRAIFFQGMEGYDDIRPGYTKVAEWDAGRDGKEQFEDYEIETGNYGMEMESEDLEVDDVTEDSATITEEVLAGDRDDHFTDAIALNGAFRMYARQDVDSLEDGLEQARDTIASGRAEAVLADLREY